jgi:AcrR family transcriptional regulator
VERPAVPRAASAFGEEEPRSDETAERVLAAALAQFEQFGLRRTTMEDVAQRAGLSRVTVYRRFAGKEALVEAVVVGEVRAFFSALDAAVGRLDSAEERLAESFAFAFAYVGRHVLFNRLLDTEPEVLLTHLTTASAPLVGAARNFIAERLGEEIRDGRLPPVEVEVVGELLVRLVLSFLLNPASVAELATDEDARRFARRYIAPSLTAVASRPA